MSDQWVEQGGGSAFSMTFNDLKSKPAAKKSAVVPQNFLKKGARIPPQPQTKDPRTSPTPTNSSSTSTAPSIKARIQSVGAKRDPFQDALVVAAPKRAARNTNEYNEDENPDDVLKDKDMDTYEVEHDNPQEDEEEYDPEESVDVSRNDTRAAWNERSPVQNRRRYEPRDDENDYEDNLDSRVRGPPSNKINPNYAQRGGGGGGGQAPRSKRSEEEFDDYQPRKLKNFPTTRRSDADNFKQFLVDKMKDLEEEISTHKKENRRLQSIAREQEQVLQKLMDEKEEQRAQLREEQQEFENYREEETKRLRQKARQLEQRAKEAAKVIPKSARDEIEMLQTQMDTLRDEMQTKETVWKAEKERLRKQIQDLTTRNHQLQQTLREQQLEFINRQFESRSNSSNSNSVKKSPSPSQSQSNSNKSQSNPSTTITTMSNTNVTRNAWSANSQQQHHQIPQHTEEEEMEEEGEEMEEEGEELEEEEMEEVEEEMEEENIVDEKPPTTSNTYHSNTTAHTNSNAVTPGSYTGRSTQLNADANRNTVIPRSAITPSIKTPDDKDEDPVEDIPGDQLVDSHTYPDGKVQHIYSSGKREIVYTNGTVKKLLPTGHICLHFSNGDVKKTFPSTKVIYYYALAQTTHTTYPNHLQVFEFVNQQVEKHFPDGMKEIIFPDGTIKYIYADGSEESIFPNNGVPLNAAKKLIKSSMDSTVAKMYHLVPTETAPATNNSSAY